MRTILLLSLIVLLVPTYASTEQPNKKPSLLIVDYNLEGRSRDVVEVFYDSDFEVFYRPYYPALVEKDVTTYDAILLLGGGDPGMSIHDVNLMINYVLQGKVLILAAPSNGRHGYRRRVNPGIHDRYQFNEILHRLNINLQILHAGHEISPVLNPLVTFEQAAGFPVGSESGWTLTTRAGTRLLVGKGAVPLLLQLDALGSIEDDSHASEEALEYRTIRRTVRIQPWEAMTGEDIELVFGDLGTLLKAQLYYRNQDSPKSDGLHTTSLKGQVDFVSESLNKLTVRISGNRWGSDYALIDVPVAAVEAAFVRREIWEESRFTGHLDSVRSDEQPFGRLAGAAVGRADRLSKGYVIVVDRDLLLGIGLPFPPIGIDQGAEINIRHNFKDKNRQFKAGLAKYVRYLVTDPESWSSEHDYPLAQIPGNPKPEIPLNNITILKTLPERVQDHQFEVVTITLHDSLNQPDTSSVSSDTKKEVDRLTDVPSMQSQETVESDSVEQYLRTRELLTDVPIVDLPMRGVWEPMTSNTEQVAKIVRVLPDLGMDFLWTVAPAASYTGDDPKLAGVDFESWAKSISTELRGSSTTWYVGVGAPDVGNADFANALDPRGEPVGLPSRFDMAYLDRYLFEPSRIIARYSRSEPNLKGIVHDWEPHISRMFEPYAMTDAFDDTLFEYFLLLVVENDQNYEEEYSSIMRLARSQRYEWLLKSGYLAEYFFVLEFYAQRLGTLYRQVMDDINPNLFHGVFIRTLQPTWFHLGFWRGVGTPERPFLVFSYEQHYSRVTSSLFFKHREISGQVFKVGLLGLLSGEFVESQLRNAVYDGGYYRHYPSGYALERGLWLVADPPVDAGLDVPAKGVKRESLLNTIRRANQK